MTAVRLAPLLVIAVSVATTANAAGPAGADEPLALYTLRGGRLDPAAAEAAAEPVGSIQKAWVVRAWADAHPDTADVPPRVSCGPASRCWNRKGHGLLGLRRAVSLSCNTYFLGLAGQIPRAAAERVFRDAGFDLHAPLTPERMIGLQTAGRPITIQPARLLESFRLLLTNPWRLRDEVRAELIAGLRDSAEDGTGSLVPAPGLAVKTGTVASLDGEPLATSGWAIAADPAGETVRLALLRSGTGAQAAARLAHLWRDGGAIGAAVRRAPSDPASAPPGTPVRPLPGTVRIRLFSALAPRRITATNAGAFPLRAETRESPPDWVGPGASRELTPGLRLSAGVWELTVEPYGLVRLVRGTLDARDGRHPVLTASLRDWAEGVVRAEARGLPAERVADFLPVVLRFLGRGPRHGTEEVCDLSHCALFGGFGPPVVWLRPETAVVESGDASRARPFDPIPAIPDGAWEEALEASGGPGPSLWSGNCGGSPLSEREVWGAGSAEPVPCQRASRHAALPPWSRVVAAGTLAAVLGRTVLSVEAVERDGVRKTAVTFASGRAELLWDDLHRRLAAVAGWNALPSPPDAWTPVPSGWKVTGRGNGHRVGYCLEE